MTKKRPKIETKEIYTVEIRRHVESGVAYLEVWKNQQGEVHRPLCDGPAYIVRNIETGSIDPVESSYSLHNKPMDSSGQLIPVERPLRVHKKYKPRAPKPQG